jgi:tRNA-specific 2-thiouridylase
MGFDGVVTGHYARTQIGPMGKTLHRAIDPLKDQSYVLAVLTTEQINGAIFPLGDTEKVDIRIEAEARGLAVAQKPDSHDICFVPSGDNAGWLRDRLGSEVGPIVDQSGKKIGEHKGAYTYTIGQRKGLGLSVAAPDGSPRFVLKIEPVTNTVVVGAREELAVSKLFGEKTIWCGPAVGAAPLRGFVQVRAHGAALDCSYYFDGERLVAELDEPLLGIANGQAMVIYDGDRVVGSATICESA